MRIIISETQLNKLIEQTTDSNYKKAYDLKASQWYWDHIRESESLRCKAYKAVPSEENYTIGYGHYGADVSSDMVLGADGKGGFNKNNCKSEANKLLREDSTFHANRLRKIFRTWENDGIDILITQGMFDSLLSLSYNGGHGGLRRSDVIQLMKTSNNDKDKLRDAAETIKTYRVSMDGHKGRRQLEYERFIENL